ncbi:hypothetical protein, partial [Streptomyces sp. WAC05950]|uniref:hypothetical protein n=1 Tax=Streptomyces sp. WAC05950 TaxID=2487419 RepID=UPI001CA31033
MVGEVAVAVPGPVGAVAVGVASPVSVAVGVGSVAVGAVEGVPGRGELLGVDDGRRDGVRPGVRPGEGAAALAPGVAPPSDGAVTGGSSAGSFPLFCCTVVGAADVGVEDTAGPSAGGSVSEELIARLTTVPSATTVSAPA